MYVMVLMDLTVDAQRAEAIFDAISRQTFHNPHAGEVKVRFRLLIIFIHDEYNNIHYTCTRIPTA